MDSSKIMPRDLKFVNFGGRDILARHYFKAELYRYIYIIIFGKHPSELYWIALMWFWILNALLVRRTSNIKS